jgi:metallophosphoesterase (TIGR00282 family)
MNILFIGDIVGRPGRASLRQVLPRLCETYGIDFTIANGENAASGIGITHGVLDELLAWGIDCVTTGNHVWAQKEVETFIANEVRLLRPANYPPGVPGRGVAEFTLADGDVIAVANLCGRVFMAPLDCPFAWADRELPALRDRARAVVIDFHAEATSEKEAFARHVDGLASAVIGTHTHVQTADEEILPGGTAYITDCGMTGPIDSVIGTKVGAAMRRFRTQMPARFTAASGPSKVCGVVISIDPRTGRALQIVRIRETTE